MNTLHILLPLLIAVAWAAPRPQENSSETTKSQSNPEYVYIQSTGPGSRQISRKDKAEPERPFETSHKLPPNLTYLLNPTEDENDEKDEIVEKVKKLKKVVKRAAPAPAGAIRLNVKQLLEKYKDDLATSTTTAKPTTKTPSRKGRARATPKKASENRRVKKSAEVTTVSSVLTTSKIAPKVEDDDVPLLASGSEKQRSRIQIKKGPNGQEYEYEYVYYYYDEEDDAKESKDKKPVNEEITNAHDGPARNEIVEKTTIASRRRTTEAPKTTVAPEVNEVVPSSTRGRGRHVVQHSEEAVSEERLPASTRFPPRSRNLNTTPSASETSSEKPASTSRPRIRRPQKENVETDNVTDETQGSTRGRTRANVKRPSLELVDSDTFNTNYNAAAPQSDQQGGPSFPTDLPAGPVRFLGVTPNESVNLPSPQKEEPSQPAEQVPSVTADENLVSDRTKEQTVTEESVGATDAMDKVALDLYAISQGNQKLLGEDNQTDADLDRESEEDATTETSTTTTPIPTTTTTTTTTTPAPTTTTTTTTTPVPSTEGSIFGRGRYRGRPGNKKATTTTTESSVNEGSSKPKKFGGNRSSFGNRRTGSRTTTTASPDEDKVSQENVKPVSSGRPSTRNRFGSGNRSRSRTTTAPSEESQDSNGVSPSTHSPRPSRPRPTFNIRGRTRPTPAPAVSEETSPGEDGATSEATVSTTAKSRRIQPGSHSAVRPLRPGPRLNLANRRIGNLHPTSSTEAPVQEDNATGDEETQKEEEDKKEETSEPAAPVDSNPINRLRNRNRIQVGTASRPKASASSPVQVRRVNPLLTRKRPGQKIEPSTEAPAETQPTEASTDVEEEEPAETVAVSSTTAEPRGLSKLLAGRRRLAGNHRLPGGN